MSHIKLLLLATLSVTSLFVISSLVLLGESFASSIQELDIASGNSSLSNASIATLNSTSNVTSNGTTQANFQYNMGAGLLQVKYTGLVRSDITPEVAQELGLNETFPGIIVTEVLPGSPADNAGFRGANMTRVVDGEIIRLGGDIIVAVDGNVSIVKDDQAFLDYLQNNKHADDNITLTILRDGKVNDVALTLGSLPKFFWYIDNDEGIRIQYPSDWSVSNRNLGRDDVIKFFSSEENTELGLPAAAVLIKVSPDRGTTLDDFAAQMMEGIPNTRMLDIRGTELSGLQAYESIFYEYGSNRTLKVKSIFTLLDDQIYRINFAADTPKYDDYLPMIDEMVRTFEFTRAD